MDKSEQRRDELLLCLLKTPPQPRPKREHGKAADKSKKKGASRASAGKREPSA